MESLPLVATTSQDFPVVALQLEEFRCALSNCSLKLSFNPTNRSQRRENLVGIQIDLEHAASSVCSFLGACF